MILFVCEVMKSIKILINLFFITFIINFFITFYSIYNFINLNIFQKKQGTKLNIKLNELFLNKGDGKK